MLVPTKSLPAVPLAPAVPVQPFIVRVVPFQVTPLLAANVRE